MFVKFFYKYAIHCIPCILGSIYIICTIYIILTISICFQYPKVRTITATSLLTALQDYSDQQIVPEEHLEEITSILEETEWMDNIEEARKQRNRLCELIGISPPQQKKK